MLRDLWILARPKGMALITLLPVIGYAFAYWDHGCLGPLDIALPQMLLLGALWAVPHMGTMWLNAALDRDEGDVLFGERVAVPRVATPLGYATIALSVVVAMATQLGLGLCVLGCAVLSVGYSHPRTAWKGHALLGPLCNALGYGVLSPLGGFLLAGMPPSPRGAAVMAISVCFISCAYLAAQAFQEQDDRARGYRTLVALFGPRVTLRATRVFLGLSVAGALGLAALGVFPRAVLLSLPFFVAADRFLVRWMQVPGGGDGHWAARFFVRLALAGLCCLVAVCVSFQVMASRGEGLGGLATARGAPDRAICADDPWARIRTLLPPRP